MKNDLISRSALNAALLERIFYPAIIKAALENVPTVDAVEVTAQEIQFLIDAMYHHIRWMIAGGLDKPECSFDERVTLSEKLRLFEREHFPDMKAETEG